MPIHKNQENPDESNTWTEYRRLVMNCIEENKARIDEAYDIINSLTLELNTLKTKIATIAGIAGFIGSLIPVILGWLLGKL